MHLSTYFKKLGPGPIIAAAFIGPGTVTVCTLAGVNFGFSLLWAIVLSIILTVILQELSGRIGLVTRQDLSQLIRDQKGNSGLRILSMFFVVLAIGMGNAAYESGNISGANMGLQLFWEAPIYQSGRFELHSGNLLLGLITLGILWIGSYQKLEKVLVSLVVCMSIAFVATAILTKPDWNSVLRGFKPSWNLEHLSTLVALIGTTVVPYNLFLYASLAKSNWNDPSDIKWMRRDIILSIVLGGVVSMAILMVGAANSSTEIVNAVDVSRGLESIFGAYAKYLMGFGLLAAGLTSSLTAPLAGGLVVCGILGWDQSIRSRSMRISMGVIVSLGLIFSSFGIKPVQLIILAQLANGIILPIISGWIIWIAGKAELLGSYRNNSFNTAVAAVLWLFTLALGLKSIFTVLSIDV